MPRRRTSRTRPIRSKKRGTLCATLEAAYHHARDRAAENESEELQEEAQAAKQALDKANHEVTELLHHQREQEHLMAKAAHALEGLRRVCVPFGAR